MSGVSERYRGRTIFPRAYGLGGGTGWSAVVFVTEDEGTNLVESQFSLKETFLTKDASLEAGIAAAKREIDERIALTQPPRKPCKLGRPR